MFDTDKEAYKYEEYIIDKLGCVYDPCYYNISRGGKGGCGTLEGKTELEKWEIYNRMKQTLKVKMSGENNPMYGRKGKNNPLYNIPLTSEHKENIRKALKGRVFTKKHKENIRKSKIGIKLSEIHRYNIGAGVKGKLLGEKNPNFGKSGSESYNAISVICLNTGEIFGSIIDAESKYNIKHQDISKVCKGKRRYAGVINEEPICWMYLDDYKKASVDIINDKIKQAKIDPRKVKIKCITTGEIFNSLREASLAYNIRPSNMSACLSGKQKTCGKLNGLKLEWIKICE